eukprot:TRINITY_DN13650_c0_g1_i1.p1 TRINITY_DN13650_c0_g1~~TRINITY_DN13650_c0_g1_i1.p1  ORF type:complete len:1021 (-),score=276.62 TRINITY_DN13650_c0_g1_i1:561-3623(-)
MGCCFGSGSKETLGRLNALDRKVKALSAGSSADGLDELGSAAKEVRQMMDQLFQEKADMQLISRVEEMSEVILRHLEDRITVDEVKSDGFKATLEKMMVVAQDLDAVRATKATKLLAARVKRHEEMLSAGMEKSAGARTQKLKQILAKLQEPGQEKFLLQAAKDVLNLAEQAHVAAPESRTIAHDIIEPLQAYAVKLLQNEAAWSVSFEKCNEVHAAAGRIDDLAQKLVAVLGAKWDPAIAPQVEHIRHIRAERVCAERVTEANKQLAADNGVAAYECLSAIALWWPLLKDTHTMEVIGIFSKLQTYANESFLKASASGDTATAESIRSFAQQFDGLRARFEGLPPSEEGGRPLGEVLEAGEAKICVNKALDSINKEVAKTKDDDKTTNLSLAATIQALEALVVAWPKIDEEARAELVEKLTASCEGLEAWTDETAAALVGGAKVGSLLKFADEYDSRRSRIEPPPAAGALKVRIASRAALGYLSQAEAELDKTEGMKPNVLLENLAAASAAIPGEVGTEEARSKFIEVCAATDERILKTFRDTLAENNTKKEVLLLKFAASADTLRAGVVGSSERPSLMMQLDALRIEMVDDLLGRLQAQLGEATPDFVQIQKCVASLASMFDKLKVDVERQQRMLELCSGISAPMTEACSRAAAQCDANFADELLRLATAIDESLVSLGRAAEVRAHVAGQALRAHLAVAGNLLGEPVALLKELEVLKLFCSEERCPADTLAQISTFVGSLEQPLQEQMLDIGQAEALTAAAVAADEARVAAGADRLGLMEKLRISVMAVKKLDEARAEVSKPSGMNPNSVVRALKDLEAAWAPVAKLEPYTKSLRDTLQQFRMKLMEATRKSLSLGAGDVRDKKLQGLRNLATEAEAAEDALVVLSGETLDRVSFLQALACVIANDALSQAEGELGKETGMNSTVLLRGIQELGGQWYSLGESEEVSDFRSRWEEVARKISARMNDAMLDAVKTGNEDKQRALLKFATDFDAACADFAGASLKSDLEAKQAMPTDAA